MNYREDHEEKYIEEKEEKEVKAGQQEMVRLDYLLSYSFVALSLLAAVIDNRKQPLSIHTFGQFQPKYTLDIADLIDFFLEW